MKTKKCILAAVTAGILSMGATAGVTAQPKVDLSGETAYHATLGIESASVPKIYRMGYYQDDVITKDMPQWKKLATGNVRGNDYESLSGVFKDARITGNGIYKVSLKNADFKNQKELAKLHVATDIPYSGKLKFKDMKVKVNNKTVLKYKKIYVNEDRKDTVLMAVNDEVKGYKKLKKDAAFLPTEEKNKITIQFTVEGFEKNQEGFSTATPTPTATPEPTISPTPEPTLSPTPVVKSEKKPTLTRTQREVGIGATVAISVLAILGIVVVVNSRKR